MPGTNDISSFSAKIEEFAQREQARATAIFRETCAEAMENIIAGGAYSPGTPVDTGHARNSWEPAINDPDRPGPPQALELGDTFYLTSRVPYMRRLEYGHSKQAPAGMVRLTMSALQRIVQGAAQRVRSVRRG